MKKLILFAASGLMSFTVMSQTARVQAIHNSADAAADTVDVWLTTPMGSSLLLDNFAFRTASPFVTAPAGVQISLGIAPKNSTSVGDVIPGLSYNYTLASNATYIIVAEGLLSSTGYSPNTTNEAFNLEVYGMGQESAMMSGNTDVLVHHGSTDAPTVDIWEATAGMLVDNAMYKDFAGYLPLATADYDLEVRDPSGSTILKAYDAPLQTLNLTNEALVVLASGFLNPSANSNGPEFGLYVALSAGGPLVALPEKKARVQAIHNSPDIATSSVDVYMTTALGTSLLIDDFNFRTASPFIDAPAGGVEFSLAFAASNSTSANDTIPGLTFNYSLMDGGTYVVVADGLVSTSGYSPNTANEAFDLKVYPMGQEVAMMTGNTDVLVHHGSTDAPMVDVDEISAGNLVDDISYGEFDGYLQLPTADYTLLLKNSAGTSTIASYDAPLQTLSLTNQALVVVASGFLNPSANSNGPAFGLYAALPTGGPLVMLPVSSTTGVDELNENNDITIYPNPANNVINIEGSDLSQISILITDIMGRVVDQSNITQISNTSLDISNIPAGIYQLTVLKVNGEISNAKFIKQ